MKDYINNIIYKICCKDSLINDIYIGHTTNINLRKNGHKSSCINVNNKDYNLPVYKFIRNNFGWENWEIIEVEKFPCENFIEATKRERYWIELLKTSLNSVMPYRTKEELTSNNKEYMEDYNKKYSDINKNKLKETKALKYQENKEIISENHKKYYQENKEEILSHQKIYYNQNKEQINEKNKIYRENNKELISDKIKQYKIVNKEFLVEKNKQYYYENKDKINEKNKIYREKIKEIKIEKDKEYREKNKDIIHQKFNCLCGGTYIYSHKSTHLKTKLHQNFVNNLDPLI